MEDLWSSSDDEMMRILSQRLQALSISKDTEHNDYLNNANITQKKINTLFPSYTKKRPFKSMEDLLTSCYEFTDNMRNLEQLNKDLSEYTLDYPKYQNCLKDCSATRLSGYIDFERSVDFYSLSKVGYEVGERCILQFIVVGKKGNNEYEKILKFYANICFLEFKDEMSETIQASFEFERNIGAPEDEEELKKLIAETDIIKISLDPENGICFESFDKMCSFLEPLWKTNLGRTLKMLLIDGYFHCHEVYKDFNTNEHWVATALGLNKEQSNALTLVENGYPLSFIQSPPGTGKTTTASSIVYANPQYKYVITAESNKGCDAISDTIEKMKKMRPYISSFNDLYACNAKKVKPVRIYSATAKIKKRNISNYCESKLKLSREFIFSEKLSPVDFSVLSEYAKVSQVIEERKRHQLTFNEISKLKKSLSVLEDRRSKIFMRVYDPNAYIMTTRYAVKHFKRNYSDCKDPDVVIVDEGGQMSLWHFILLAACFPYAKFAIFGDTKQLPPYLPIEYTPELTHRVLTYSIIDFLEFMDETPKVELNVSYRMHPELLGLVSRTFYDNKLFPGVPETMRSIVVSRLKMPNNSPMAWFDTKGCEHRMDMKTSTSNDKEAYFTTEFVKLLLASGYQPSQIGIICMYKAQVSKIYNFLLNPQITIDTVDAFQGNEKDIIIICTSKTAKNNFDKCSDFLGDSRRINVAISRARCALFIFGDFDFLTKNFNWSAVAKFFKVSKAIDSANNMNLLFPNNTSFSY
ncbi:Regulator of nonsense transcripts 1 [Strongyloides ratti]|uniref:Regulator of nonsense transcripts 1 n=1 Tax=Strongyloides ratti TaxID=34506 RepID=A0A090LRJ2_STRRB|nr:Regulator of nonsense transcripts 1 [Strongyloides ratti]CEF70181.1 Regulator of nonsense transcripts 1 [Strongyloides ratti]